MVMEEKLIGVGVAFIGFHCCTGVVKYVEFQVIRRLYYNSSDKMAILQETIFFNSLFFTNGYSVGFPPLNAGEKDHKSNSSSKFRLIEIFFLVYKQRGKKEKGKKG